MAIKVIARETGAVEALSIIDRHSGCDWVQDLIGNAGALVDGQFVVREDGCYEADAATIKWWQDYICDHEAVEDAIESLREDMADAGMDDAQIEAEIGRVNDAVGGADAENERCVAEAELAAIRQERGLDEAEA